ncbi:MAG: precorrin-3B synthase [Actinophytocola sp.]|nr:precorrin-3B synthase [Actinophytocola sp.]
MPSVAGTPSARSDACPGVLTTHRADDGELVRVRVPGGQLTDVQLGVLADVAAELGDGVLHLTSRGNLQLRAVADAAELSERLAAAGLLPSATHERVRNIVASPLSGLLGGLADVRPLVAELDAAVCATPALAALPGRFLFGFDDGRGDVGNSSDDRIDVCWRAVDDRHGVLLLAGVDHGVRAPIADAVPVTAATAAAFVSVRGDAWQVRELGADDAEALAARVRAERRLQSAQRTEWPIQSVERTEGVFQRGGLIGVGLRFGALSSHQARVLARLSPNIVLTPWRSVLVANLDPAEAMAAADALAQAGLVLDPRAPELAVSACIGRPGCGKALADVRADATNAMSELATSPDPAAPRAHFSGCTRRCGRPRTPAVDVLAGGDGYLVDGEPVPAERLGAVLAEKGHE